MNLDGDKIYTKIVAFVEFYNFVVPNPFFIWNYCDAQLCSDLKFEF
jgi:hypothetical protein